MKKLFVTFAILTNATMALANQAEISATYAKSKLVKIALDGKQIPRVDKNSKSHPTIKDFAKGTDYTDVCYAGEKMEMEKLLKALVSAGNGDGDSYAQLKSIKLDKDKKIIVKVDLEDESGMNVETYQFSPCERQVTTKGFSCNQVVKGNKDYIKLIIGFPVGESPEIISARWFERNKDSVQPLFFSMPDLNVVPHSGVNAKVVEYTIPSDSGDRLKLSILAKRKDLAMKKEFSIKASTENGRGFDYLSEQQFKCVESVD